MKKNCSDKFIARSVFMVLSFVAVLTITCFAIFHTSTGNNIIRLFAAEEQQNETLKSSEIVLMNETAALPENLLISVKKAYYNDGLLCITTSLTNSKDTAINFSNENFELSVTDISNAENDCLLSSESFNSKDIHPGESSEFTLTFYINNFLKNNMYTLNVYDNNKERQAQIIIKDSDIIQ